MKKIILAFVAVLFLLSANSQSLKTPAPSPTTTVKQDFGLSSIELSYSRPGVKGRKIFGELVPFGTIWRTGANSATTITFGDEVTIGGTKIPAGKYGLLTIPGKDNWIVIISKNTTVTFPADYKQDEDVVRVDVKPFQLPFSIQSFTIGFADLTSSSCVLDLMWDSTYIGVPITTDIDSKVMAQINDMMNKDTRPYYAAAMYYLDNGKDEKQALAWLNKAVEQQANAYWVHYQRAKLLAKMGNKEEAKKESDKSMALAKDAKNAEFIKFNEELQEKLK